MNIPKVLDKLDREQNMTTAELRQLKIEVNSVRERCKTIEAVLKSIGKEMGKLNKNLSKAGDECACEPIGNENQCEETH